MILGGGITAATYGQKFQEADIPIKALLDTKPRENVKALNALEDVEYYQLPSQYCAKDVEEILARHPNSALVVMTPQHTHANILSNLGGMISQREILTWIDKPLVMTAKDVQMIIDLITKFPNLAHLLVSGGFTLDKATPELILMGNFSESYPYPINDLPSVDELGSLRNVRFLFMEGSQKFREVVGSYGRPHLAFYPGGGMLGDLLEHLTDKLIRMDIIDLDSQPLSVYLGYTPIGESTTSFPWQVPQATGLAETEAELIISGKNGVPIFLNFGKRLPEFLGDIRRSILDFENFRLKTDYSTSKDDYTASLLVVSKDGQSSKHILKGDPYILMLKRYQMLWNGEINGEGGIYVQLVNALLIDGVYKAWKGEIPSIFRSHPKAKQFRNQDYNQSGYYFRQQRDWESFIKMHPEFA